MPQYYQCRITQRYHTILPIPQELTRKPHLAATPRDDVLARMIRDRFVASGFDTADLVPYDLLLSRPNHTNPNLITLTNGAGEEVFRSAFKEIPLHEDDEDPEFVHSFNAYTPAGLNPDPGVGVVYANYGRVEDFDELDRLGVNVTGRIVMARYGKIFRGNKIQHAQDRNAVGVILFSDPLDVALEGVTEEAVYPNKGWLPGTGMQRGTTFMGDGDPLTPGWPSTEHAYRVDKEEAGLAQIPCQPIGYNDAKVILEKLRGDQQTPESWVGGLEGVEYNLGPYFKADFSDYRLRLQTHNYELRARSYNVIGTIKGEVEPDRYVFIGNHRDAWGYGGSDPSSGTAQMLETARVLGELMKDGWRPRRSIVFCSWGAEEYGLIGSTEWVEVRAYLFLFFSFILRNKIGGLTMFHVNTDTCASGPILHAPGSPLLWDPIVKIAKMVPGVRNGETVYEEWEEYEKLRNHSTPEMRTLGSGSDYAHFSFYCGIPCLDIWFRRDKNKYDISIYPAYHTGYDTFYNIDHNIDPGFRIHQGCSRIASLTLRYFADSAIIPYSLEKLPTAIKNAFEKVKEKGNGEKLMAIYDKFPLLGEAIDNFTMTTSGFVAKINQMKEDIDPVTLRSLNDQIMKLEQIFIMPAGLPGRPTVRHAIFAPSQFDNYATAGFPGISDLLYGYDSLGTEEMTARQKEIRRHISDLTILVQRASSLLEDFHSI
ncbi:N-acetylated-alpha-linked acidic dipeptidase 2-like [Penaeus monodon]|uniref:N-acetylated-alpha-linked acidic dipeptidase 2-like n=1 Tax=Penaeus monodon TaxID=6687 RepID=UPI0018A70C49|nr:N-acetylated-alpha-linked acidic dipeptidase 2-like [Penaeus monodon]